MTRNDKKGNIDILLDSRAKVGYGVLKKKME